MGQKSFAKEKILYSMLGRNIWKYLRLKNSEYFIPRIFFANCYEYLLLIYYDY